jgi:hypothetical protein
MRDASGLFVIIAAFCLVGGCARPQGRGLADDDASFKIPAIKSAVQQKDERAIPQLVADLESSDPAVRFYAIEGLERLTGETFGYDYYDDEPDRQQAVDRWKQWLADRQKK